jgi:hypothetical protein
MKRLLTGALALLLSLAASATTYTPIQLLNPAGSVSGQVIVSSGPTTVAAWGGIGLNGITAVAANTVLANATGSSASPTAFAMPGCSASGSVIQWTSGTGFNCATGYAQLASPAFTGAPSIANSATSGTTLTVSATSNTTHGAALELSGNGATTPNKFIRVLSGILQIINSSNTASILALDDSGNLSVNGSLTTSQTAGVIGTTTNNSANAGSVGEYVTNTSGAVSLTTVVAANATSQALTAGDWDVVCTGYFIPAGTPSSMELGLSTTSATQPASTQQITLITATMPAAAQQVISTPPIRMSLSSTTTLYCVATAGFTSTETVTGYIRARRVR